MTLMYAYMDVVHSGVSYATLVNGNKFFIVIYPISNNQTTTRSKQDK